MSELNSDELKVSLKLVDCPEDIQESILNALLTQEDVDSFTRIVTLEIISNSLEMNFARQLIKLVDESQAHLNDVVKSLIILSLHDRFTNSTPKEIMGFLSCCIEFQSIRPSYSDLPSLVNEFLGSMKL